MNEKGSNLSRTQFGFRRGRSTIDAITEAREYMEELFKEGKVVIGVSLDIKNAFNSMPWRVIGMALNKLRIPLYIRRIIRDYLSGRKLSFPKNDGTTGGREVERGVPQGSILGPLLWNVGFDAVMNKKDLPIDCKVICYADDTMIMAGGEDWEETTVYANLAVDTIIHRIEDRELEVSPSKTEIVGFHEKGRQANTTIRVAGKDIKVGRRMKYLGLILDNKWSFIDHFTELAPRLERSGLALSRLLPNLGGPNNKVRKLYINVITSIALYGAPIWAYEVKKSRKCIQILRATQRRMTGRLIRAYKTTSFAINTALAGIPPLELKAREYEEVYERISEIRRNSTSNTPVQKRAVDIIKEGARRKLIGEWKTWIRRQNQGEDATLMAIEGQLQEWTDARIGLSFRMTQILTGHGCFGRYLHRIGKENTNKCWHCNSQNDTARHTLSHCPAWNRERVELRGEIGVDLSWEAIIRNLRREKGRKAIYQFCEKVMTKKEVAERNRQGVVNTIHG